MVKKDKILSKRYAVNSYMRIVIGSVLFILGFSYSNTAFFKENPLFGIRFLAETGISGVAFLFGFFIVPSWFVHTKGWLENLVVKTISDIISTFWAQQSARMRESGNERDKNKRKKKDEILKENLKGALLLDTSILIDGRVLELAKTGFIPTNLVILRSVLNELQLISDSADDIKRKKGRRGLAIAERLKKLIKVTILDIKTIEEPVDKELVDTANKYKMNLMTLDFNLNKVASISGIRVLNLNDLSNALKTSVLPGERFKIKIIAEGKEKEQGIGYLPDGTMIVVQKGKDRVGQEVDVKVAKIIQTSAGKMIFTSVS